MTKQTRFKNDESNDRLVLALLEYLDEHPLAADTVDGILSQWLPADARHSGRATLETVLSRLVDFGWLRRNHVPQAVGPHTSAIARRPRTH